MDAIKSSSMIKLYQLPFKLRYIRLRKIVQGDENVDFPEDYYSLLERV